MDFGVLEQTLKENNIKRGDLIEINSIVLDNVKFNNAKKVTEIRPGYFHKINEAGIGEKNNPYIQIYEIKRGVINDRYENYSDLIPILAVNIIGIKRIADNN